jgi:hypothetical protein
MSKTSFPGFKACIQMMRKHDPQLKENGFALLSSHAHEVVDELINEFQNETDHGLKCWILELLGEARSEKATALFQQYLKHEDESFRYWAAQGLHQLNTKQAKQILWDARSSIFATQSEAEQFLKMLNMLQAKSSP